MVRQPNASTHAPAQAVSRHKGKVIGRGAAGQMRWRGSMRGPSRPLEAVRPVRHPRAHRGDGEGCEVVQPDAAKDRGIGPRGKEETRSLLMLTRMLPTIASRISRNRVALGAAHPEGSKRAILSGVFGSGPRSSARTG